MGSVCLIGASGYIGSRLVPHVRDAGHDLVAVDRSPEADARTKCCDYRDLTPSELSSFDTLIWLAGHSSVQQASAEPAAAIENNVSGLLRLARSLRGDQRLIYASTAALYSGARFDGPLVSEESVGGQFQNAYDLSKFACDTLMPAHTANFCALRFGTVCGISPRPRHELLLNALVRSAVTSGEVRVSNPHAMRSVLAMDDLLAVVLRMLANPPPTGFYNLASYSMSIGEFGRAVATQLGAKLVEVAGMPTYSFTIDSGKLRRAIGAPDAPSLATTIEQLAAFYA